MIMRSKLFRALIGVAVVGLILVMLGSWWGDYRAAAVKDAASQPTTTSPNPVSAMTPQKVLVLTDGVNLREKPDITAKMIRGLKRGETLDMVGKSGSWMQVRESGGAIGWVSDNPQYLKVEK